MKRTIGHIVFILAIFVMICSCKRARVIPEERLVDICTEMFLADQWISHSGLYSQSDTHFVYRPIFEKYGYTADDFRLTVSTYIQEPEEFAEMFTKVTARLNDRLAVINKVDSIRVERESIRRADSLRWAKVPSPVLYKDILVGQFPSDTVCFGPDSIRYTINVPVLDTMFAGPRIVLKGDEPIEKVSKAVIENDEPDDPPRTDGSDVINHVIDHDARRTGLRTDNQQKVRVLPRYQPVATERKAL